LPRPRGEFLLVTIVAVGFDFAVHPPRAEFLAFGKDGALDDFDADMVAAAAGTFDSSGEHGAVSAQGYVIEKGFPISSPAFYQAVNRISSTQAGSPTKSCAPSGDAIISSSSTRSA
jgi:hypothetical protein